MGARTPLHASKAQQEHTLPTLDVTSHTLLSCSALASGLLRVLAHAKLLSQGLAATILSAWQDLSSDTHPACCLTPLSLGLCLNATSCPDRPPKTAPVPCL